MKLIFSQAITLTNAQPLKVTLGEDTQVLDEVVVTALGIKRSEKALTYNVQQVKGDELTTVKSTNFMGALAGKAAGVQINSSASGPGGGVKVVMRGAKSITQNNNALYVIDGIPMYNRASSGGDGAMATQPSSESIADINPDDIESMSLLTGPSAAALYGYEGANGVVLITTKKGRADKTTVTYSNNTTFSDPMMMPKFQNTYGNMTGEMMSWGLETDKRYDPANFFNTGSNVSNALSLSTGNDKSQSYISVATTNATGIIPNNDYDRYNFSFRNTTNFLNNKFILDTSANYIIQNDKNMVSQGQYFNPLTSLYLFPRGEDFSDVAVYERYDDLSGVNTQYWPYGDLGGVSSQNPYWIMNRMNRENDRRRYKLAASLQYNIIEGLNVQGRVSIDNTESKYTEKFHAGTVGNFAGPKGRYKEENRLDRQVYADVLANFNKTFNEFNVTANLGASIKDLRMELTSLHGDLNNVTNHFTIENLTRSGYYKVNADGLKRQTQSVFANAEIRQVYDNGVPTSLSTYKTYRKILDKRKIPRRTLRGGEKIQLLDGVPFTVVGPLEKSNARGENSRQNNESIVGLLKYGNFTMLFTGDAEAEEEASILKSGADVKSIVLKAGHHGSKTSSTEEFLRAVSPKAVFISCGAGNNYGHPSRQTMKRLEKWGIDVYRTDRQGTITLTTDGKRYEITKEH